MKTKFGGIALTVFLLGLLGGCGGGGGGAAGGSTSTGSLSGTAAVGYPISGGTINVVCATGSALTTTTGSTGSWNVTLSGQTLPCAVQVTGGTVNSVSNPTSYHSIAIVSGTVNVTPLTDLLVANLAGSATPATWFAGLNTATLSAITQPAVDAALAQLRAALVALTPLSGINPVTTVFTPTSGNSIDDMLSALGTAMSGAGVSYTTLLGSASATTFTPPAGFGAALATAFAGTPSGAVTPVFNGTEAATAGDTQVTITWAAVTGAGSYNIQRSVSGGAFSPLATNVASPYQDTGLTNGTSYSYIVVARNAANTADLAQSATLSATPAAASVPSISGNGLVVKLGGHDYMLTNASVYRFSPSGKRELDVENPQISAVALADMTQYQGAYVTTATLTVAKAKGNQVCGATAADASLSLVLYGGGDWTGTFTASSCAITVDYMSSLGGMGGEIVSATLSNGVHTINLANAPFRVYQHSGTAGTASALAANEWASFNVTGGSYEFPAGNHFKMDGNTGNKVGSSFSYGLDPKDGVKPVLVNGIPSNIVWIVQNSFFTTAKDYNCGTVYTGGAGMNMQLWLGTYLAEYAYYSAGGGNCVITIDQIGGGLYHGTYSASLISTDALLAAGEKTVAINGEFRNFLTDAYHAGNGGNEGGLPADGLTNGATLLVGSGSTHWVDTEQFLFNYDSNSFMTANSFRSTFTHPANSKLQLRLFEIPRATGDYTCGTLYNNEKVYMDILTDRGVTYSSNWTAFGTACTVHISRYDTVIEGTYTATLGVGNAAGLASSVLPNNDALIDISGSFRALAP